MHYDFPTFSHSNLFHNAMDLDVFLTWKFFFHSTFRNSNAINLSANCAMLYRTK